MAAIKDTYDLSSGTTRSLTITGGTYLDIHAFLTTVTGLVSYYIEKRNSATGDWISVRDGVSGKKVSFSTNGTDENGITITGLSGDDTTTYSVNIIPGGSTTGTLTLDCNTDGTIES